MNRKWMNKTLLALSIQVAIGGAYAAEEPVLGEYEVVGQQQTDVDLTTSQVTPSQTEGVSRAEEPALGGYETVDESETAVVSAPSQPSVNTATQPVDEQSQASSALQQQDGDASKETS